MNNLRTTTDERGRIQVQPSTRQKREARPYPEEISTPLAIHDDIEEPDEGGPVVALFWAVYLLALAMVGWGIGWKLGFWRY
jgi:hypothetical protein